MKRKYNNGFWCDAHQDDANGAKDFVKGTRFEDDECLHGLCKECHKKLLAQNLSVLHYFSENYF